MNRKSIIRNYDNVLLALSIALSVFMIMNAIQIISIGREQLNYSKYEFTSNYLVEDREINVSDMEKIVEIAKDKNISFYFDGVKFKVGELFEGMNVLIYLYDNSDAAWNKDENSLIIGHSIHNFVSSSDGRSNVKLGELNYFIHSEKKNNLIEDDTILVNWGNLTQEYKDSIVQGINERDSTYVQLYITIESDSRDVLEGFSNELRNMEQLELTECNREDSTNYLQSFQDKMLLTVLGVLIVFNIICSITISSLWIYRRDKEYLICRAFGFNMIQLVLRILKEVFCIFLLAVVIGIASESLYLCMRGCSFIKTSYLKDQVIGLIITMPVILLLIVLYPCIKISKSNLSQSSIDSSI